MKHFIRTKKWKISIFSKFSNKNLTSKAWIWMAIVCLILIPSISKSMKSFWLKTAVLSIGGKLDLAIRPRNSVINWFSGLSFWISKFQSNVQILARAIFCRKFDFILEKICSNFYLENPLQTIQRFGSALEKQLTCLRRKQQFQILERSLQAKNR